jgi:hypothetical protein
MPVPPAASPASAAATVSPAATTPTPPAMTQSYSKMEASQGQTRDVTADLAEAPPPAPKAPVKVGPAAATPGRQ